MTRSAAAHGDQWRSPPGFNIRASFFPVFSQTDTKLPNTSGMIYERPDLKSEARFLKAALYLQTTRGRPSWLQICWFWGFISSILVII